MAAAAVGADKKGGKRRLAPAVMLGLLGASLLVACAPLGPQTVEPGVTPGQQPAEVQEAVIVPTEEPTRQPEVVEVVATEMPTETPEPTQEPTATPEPEMGMQNEQGQWWDGAGWQILPDGEGWQVTIPEDGQVRANNGAESVIWVEGKWLIEAQIETQKVVEYVVANSEVINRVPMDWITLRATRELQEAVRSGLPSEEQQYQSPLFAIVTDVERLENLLSTFSIDVVGVEGRVSLGDRSQVERVEFVFMSGNEEPGFRLPVNIGHSAVTETQFGAYKSGKTVYVVMRLGDHISTIYDRDEGDEIQFFTDGMVLGLWLLSMSPKDIGTFTSEFKYNSPYDSNNPGSMLELTRLAHMVAVRPEHSQYGDLYTQSGFYNDYVEWIPLEFRLIIEAMNW